MKPTDPTKPAAPISEIVASVAASLRLPSLSSEVSTAGSTPSFFTVTAPFTSEAIGRLPTCGKDDVRLAVDRAREAQKKWAAWPMDRRRRIFLRFHDRVLDRRDSLMDVVQLESGKARLHALEEVFDVAIVARHYAYHADRYLRPRRRRGALPLLTRTLEHHQAVGVVGIISPWNYPLTLAVSDAVPALMAGNAVVLKPSELTPYTALYARALLRECGLPSDLFQVVTGSGRTVGPALVDRVDFVMFTGSTATGRSVYRRAAERLIPCSMELGGKNPVIVLEDADLARAAEGVIRGAFANAGQLCLSFERLYIQREVYEPFLRELIPRMDALRLAPGFDFEADVGSLVSKRQLEIVQTHVKEALEKGATLLTGGRTRPDAGPFFYEPTLLVDVTEEMTVCRTETFGPVLSAYAFGSPEDAAAAANDSDFGLNASIWSKNPRKAEALAQRLECGTVNINEGYAAAWASVDAPQGGMKASGLGARHGSQGIRKYTKTRTVAVQRLLPIGPSRYLPPLRFEAVMSRALRWLRRIPGLR